MPKHYRPPGKKKEGNAAKYITRTKAIKYLQISLPTFRRLCIIKGVVPREPKKKVEGNHKTYYHIKDITFLAHEPLLCIFRDIRAYDKKIKKALAKKNKDRAAQLQTRRPSYRLDRIIRERYPKFIDALRDLDDGLTMVHLFAALPAVQSEGIEVKRIHNCRRLCDEWQAYISRTHSLRKTFISVKGIYYQAEVEGQKITWLTPHALQQVLSDDVDFKVMLTFLEIYETLLAFVNFKLYNSINVKYPPILDPQLEKLASEHVDATKKDSQNDESNLRLAQLQNQLPANEPGTLMHLVNDVADDADDADDDDVERKECKSLFKNLKFFLSREVPRVSLLFIIPAFGGLVSWEGDGSPFKESDEGITHQIVDRPSHGHIFLSREYVQPQWIFDCVNARIILPTADYLVGRVLPPHLSPFVENEAVGYVPEYAEKIKRLQAAARKELLPMPGVDQYDVDGAQNLLAEGILSRTEASDAAKRKQQMAILEKQYLDELEMELQGVHDTASVSKRQGDVEKTEAGEESVPGPAEVDKDADNMSMVVMSRKKRRLYEAMKISNERKKENVELLKKRKIQASKTTPTL